MDWTGQRVLVVGLGVSGLSVARFVSARGAEVTLNDVRPREQLRELCEQAEAYGVRCVLGSHPEELFDNADVVVVSPGVPLLAPIERALGRGTPVLSEIEVASRHIEAPIVAITGTNGKSTVTTLVGEICKHADIDVFVGGNLGTPLVDAIGTTAATDGVVIVELSSFQLERVSTLHAHIAVLLNISDDHLDRYDSFDDYAAAKARIFERQGPADMAVVPADDPEVSKWVPDGPRRQTFGLGDGDVQVTAGDLLAVTDGWRIRVDDIAMRGAHNHLNACAAVIVARALGIEFGPIEAVLRSFAGLRHRMEFVGSVHDVDFIDDSKATNVGAAVAAIDGLGGGRGRVVLIAGGRDKGGAYDPLRQRMEDHGRAVVLIGEAAELIEQAFAGSSVVTTRAETMQDAVARGAALADPGDVVLLAPACSSFDMFRSYGERGDRFQHAVRALGAVS